MVDFDVTKWMPSGMEQSEKDAYARRWPNDPHRAAAQAWEDWAARMDVAPVIMTASTGAQNVSYAPDGHSAFQDANARARWHRARCKAYSVHTASMGTDDPLLGGDAA